VNSLNKWYQRLGAFLVGFGVFTAALFIVRFTFLKSIGFVIFLDDFLTIGLANIFLFPCGIWLLHIGSHSNKYVKVNRYPLALISISPISIVIMLLVLLSVDFGHFSIKFMGKADALVLYFSIIAVCAVSFISGNMLLLCQIIKSKKGSQISRSGLLNVFSRENRERAK
jgi:hypothetical protein